MNPSNHPGVPVRHITKRSLLEARNILLGKGLSPHSVRKCLQSVRKVLRQCRYHGKIDRVPPLPVLYFDEIDPAPLDIDEVEKLLQEDPVCFWCGRELCEQTSTLDHVVARSRGGSNDITNLVLSCVRCQQRKGGGPLVGLATQIRQQHGETAPRETAARED